MKLLCVGPIWRGSNAGGLFKAIARQGALIEIVDEFYQIPLEARSLLPKVIAKLSRNQFLREYNREILAKFQIFRPDIVLVYKGAFVYPETLALMKKSGTPLVNFFPDVSFRAHGNLLPKTLPVYDHIFTTKTFGITDLKTQLGISSASFIPHGFDPEIHRPINQFLIPEEFFCEVSFIGTFSQKKEKLLGYLVEKLPSIKLKVWGEQWHKSTNSLLKPFIQGRQILGDLYAAAISASLINLGFLSEQVSGASSGDLITSRTFHIPASGGFLLHERNEQSVTYYKEDEEAAFFEDEVELVQKITKFLNQPEVREKIRQAGYHRALREHSLDQRAKSLVEQLNLLINEC
ncbi:glycosyltransferase [Algoriphagus sp.]|uniref:CgeB family protein n=1 Tax=Algoriphagus sp. TaxID=1872435 RepID=UPI002603BDEB|nr:glycosyltransferase [Algoriphagus sp.]